MNFGAAFATSLGVSFDLEAGGLWLSKRPFYLPLQLPL
jgi:hypothetical protein